MYSEGSNRRLTRIVPPMRWRADVMICAAALHAGLLLWAAHTPLNLPAERADVEWVMEVTLSTTPRGERATELAERTDQAEPITEVLPTPVLNAVEPAPLVEANAPVDPEQLLMNSVVAKAPIAAEAAKPVASGETESLAAPTQSEVQAFARGSSSVESSANGPTSTTSTQHVATGVTTVPATGGGEDPRALINKGSRDGAGRIAARLLNHERATQRLAREAGRNGWRGSVEVLVDLDATGRALTASISISSGNAALDAAALRTVLGFSFSPAMQDGAAVASKLLVPLRL
ncbi:MAG: energy transducer TonB [Planctomycetes bacterium]|nr:energy transducer TonB [Planctomycetota bacterium]